MNCVAVTLQCSFRGKLVAPETHVSCGWKNDGKNCRSLYFASIKKQTGLFEVDAIHNR